VGGGQGGGSSGLEENILCWLNISLSQVGEQATNTSLLGTCAQCNSRERVAVFRAAGWHAAMCRCAERVEG
jgi:hypothetical protein